MTEKIAIVTGGSSGIGLCTAAALHEKGCRVYTLSRREFSDPRFTHLRADVTDAEAAEAAVGFRHVREEDDRRGAAGAAGRASGYADHV